MENGDCIELETFTASSAARYAPLVNTISSPRISRWRVTPPGSDEAMSASPD
eukprot:CAMPEP_0201932064 /NCGR_PEP_ID=MMETSP0903-20130614/28690_1 /ASSEMBLY_ACC=CAM_ASM_000552 /TAXON_ID=420261 /ORGANISM="Thalassiosira antarctica, Strain CCMP982" /LENGTH=51 /DNA_ID=CAMNT_0048471567 /DNA_START=103 /DNA_END=258 /DNA_ORIENTATION=-